jgi:hypothetical protein
MRKEDWFGLALLLAAAAFLAFVISYMTRGFHL